MFDFNFWRGVQTIGPPCIYAWWLSASQHRKSSSRNSISNLPWKHKCTSNGRKENTHNLNLKLYCRYLYTRPCMINHIWGLKQLWLQVNGHAWFHLQRLRWPVRNGEGAKNSKWKYMSPAGFEPTPRQSTTGKLQRLRPLDHEGLMVISG